MRWAVTLLLALQMFGEVHGESDPFAVFQPTAMLTAADRQQLDRGAPLVKILAGEGQELAAIAAVAVGPEVTAERAAAWLDRLEALRANRYLLATGRFSFPPALADLDGLVLDRDDLEDLHRCRPGRCDLKLSEREIDTIRGRMAAAGGAWRSAAQLAFREAMLRRVEAYLGGGLAALPPYRDRKHVRSPLTAFRSLVEHSSFLQQRLPGLIDDVLTCPARMVAHGGGYLYWSKERLGGKPVITITHVVVKRATDGSTETLAVGVQILATHYIEASIGVTAIVRGSDGRRYLVYVNRSDVDVLGGFWGGLARAIIESRVRKDASKILTEIADRLSRGDPSTWQAGPPPRR